MKTPTILVALFIICGLWLSPSKAAASAGYMIDDTTAVFFLDFGIDASYAAFGIPVFADHTILHNDRADVLGYKLIDQTGATVTVAHVADLVLSHTALQDTRYQVAKGATAGFTLMSIVTFAEPINTPITATVTKLPFWTDGTRTTLHQNQIDELDTAIVAVN